jgi:hypothetical protein
MDMKKSWPRNRTLWILAVGFVVIIKFFSLNPERVEILYTSGFYLFFSSILRFLFGWIPFSFGDILYLLAGCWLLGKLIKAIKSLFRRQFRGRTFLKNGLKALLGFIFIYIIFNVLWGLNYNRQGIAHELALTQMTYDTSDIILLQDILLQKVNSAKNSLIRQNDRYPEKHELFKRAKDAYNDAEKIYPFLQYKILSVKSSLYGWWGNYLGFTGYYNPFTGEAQVNTSVPKFLQPYISTHEMAHQLGYAKEDEANFVGYLAAVNSRDTLFHYSVYLDLYIYANREVYYFDSVASMKSRELLMPQVKKDIEEWRQFNLNHRSFIEPAISWMYGNYLKLNEQPKGLRSYNAVIATLIAYYKKYGKI